MFQYSLRVCVEYSELNLQRKHFLHICPQTIRICSELLVILIRLKNSDLK